MLGKDDALKVVLKPATDPGADKRGLLRSGQVLPIEENTGGACSLPSPRNCSRKGADIGAAQLLQFICTGLGGQTLLGAEGVPIAKGLRGRDADFRRGDDAPSRFEVGQGGDLLAAVEAQNGAADQEQGHVGAHLSGNFKARGLPGLNIETL